MTYSGAIKILNFQEHFITWGNALYGKNSLQNYIHGMTPNLFIQGNTNLGIKYTSIGGILVIK